MQQFILKGSKIHVLPDQIDYQTVKPQISLSKRNLPTTIQNFINQVRVFYRFWYSFSGMNKSCCFIDRSNIKKFFIFFYFHLIQLRTYSFLDCHLNFSQFTLRSLWFLTMYNLGVKRPSTIISPDLKRPLTPVNSTLYQKKTMLLTHKPFNIVKKVVFGHESKPG